MRHLPSPSVSRNLNPTLNYSRVSSLAYKGGSFVHGQFHAISGDMSRNLFQRWMNEIPNEGLIYYRYLFNVELIFVSLADTITRVTISLLDSLPFLHAVCNEILRLHPPSVITLRKAVHDTGTLIPKSTLFTVCPYAVNLSSSLWGPDSQVFNPEMHLFYLRIKVSFTKSIAIY